MLARTSFFRSERRPLVASSLRLLQVLSKCRDLFPDLSDSPSFIIADREDRLFCKEWAEEVTIEVILCEYDRQTDLQAANVTVYLLCRKKRAQHNLYL